MTGETIGPSQRAAGQSLFVPLSLWCQGDLARPLKTCSPRQCLLTGMLPSPPQGGSAFLNLTLVPAQQDIGSGYSWERKEVLKVLGSSRQESHEIVVFPYALSRCIPPNLCTRSSLCYGYPGPCLSYSFLQSLFRCHLLWKPFLSLPLGSQYFLGTVSMLCGHTYFP